MIKLKDRVTAGKQLAEKLKHEFSKGNWKDAIVLALPRGGLPVAWEVAQLLKLPLDVVLVKKIGAPNHTEYAIGAISEDDMPVWNQEAIDYLGLSLEDLQYLAEQAYEKILDQTNKWRKYKQPLMVKDRTAIVVDDGLATGLTMQAAAEFLKRAGASSVVVAVPVAPLDTVSALSTKVDQVVVLHTPEPFLAVGQWYEDFTQVSDEDVTRFLAANTTNILIRAGDVSLAGDLSIPLSSNGVVIFAHGSGSSHTSPRNQQVAKELQRLGFATLLIDLLTPDEAIDRSNVFNIPLLAERLLMATEWIRTHHVLSLLPICYFGASTGAAAALVAAAHDQHIAAIVSRGGRPDLAYTFLDSVICPTLLIVGSEDHEVIILNQQAKSRLKHSELHLIPGATHLFEEPGAMDEVIKLTGDWFLCFQKPDSYFLDRQYLSADM